MIKRFFFYACVIIIILYLFRLIRKKTENAKSSSLMHKKFVVPLEILFYPLIFIQLIYLIAEGWSDIIFWLITLAISIVCFFLIPYLSKKKNNLSLAIILSTVKGFFIGWIISWIVLFISFISQGFKLAAGGSGEAIFAFIVLIVSTLIGSITGIIDIIIKSMNKEK